MITLRVTITQVPDSEGCVGVQLDAKREGKVTSAELKAAAVMGRFIKDKINKDEHVIASH